MKMKFEAFQRYKRSTIKPSLQTRGRVDQNLQNYRIIRMRMRFEAFQRYKCSTIKHSLQRGRLRVVFRGKESFQYLILFSFFRLFGLNLGQMPHVRFL